MVWATIIGITSLNRSHAWMTARFGNGEPRPEFRMPLLQLGMCLSPVGLIVFAWTAQEQMHWIYPLLGSAIFCCGTQVAYISTQVYIVDAFEAYAASALAGGAVARGFVGCILTMLGFKLYVSLGTAGKNLSSYVEEDGAKIYMSRGTTLLAFLCIAALPIPSLLYVYGPRLRKSGFEH